MNWKKELKDQAAHLAAAFLFLSPAAFFGGVLGFALSGLCIGIVREWTEGDGVNLRSALDVVFWGLGGAVVGFFL